MILLEFSGYVSVVGRHADRSLQAIWSQVSKGVDPFETSAVRKVKCGNWIVGFSVPTCFSEISKGQALQWRGKDVAMRNRLFQQVEESFHRIATPGCRSQIPCIIGQQSGQPIRCEAVFIVCVP